MLRLCRDSWDTLSFFSEALQRALPGAFTGCGPSSENCLAATGADMSSDAEGGSACKLTPLVPACCPTMAVGSKSMNAQLPPLSLPYLSGWKISEV